MVGNNCNILFSYLEMLNLHTLNQGNPNQKNLSRITQKFAN